jgi:Lrp/AsnC family transcriptional regulator for asnA, asnC and gidA
LDKVDYEILCILSKDARVPLTKIAAKLGVSKLTVSRRFKKLQEDGVVRGSSVILSSRACGFKELVGFLIKTKGGTNISEIKDKLNNVPKIHTITQDWGFYDFYIEAFLRDLSEMHEVVENLRRIQGIISIALIVYKQQDWAIPYAFSFPASCPWLSPEVRSDT